MMKQVSCLTWTLLLVTRTMAAEIGFIEDFALAPDRAATLRQLIPGTEDYYFYHCLHALNTEQYDRVEALTRPWLERFGQTPRLTEIQTRHALLTYNRDPQRTLTYLRTRLGLRFDHQRTVPGADLELPTALDARLIARDTLKARAFARHRNLDGFEDAALDWLATDNLDAERRRNLLQRLTRPDLPGLARLVADDLRAPNALQFGSYSIHRQMTLAQLEELVGVVPELLNHSALVQTWLSKLQPSADEDWRHDPAATRAYLDRLLTFVRRLAPAHNALKAHVLYHRLVFDRSQGNYDRELFLEYLRLPRRQPYMAKALLDAPESHRYPANLEADFSALTQLAVVGSDEPLVRSYLKHFLVTAASPQEFEPYVNDVYLRHLFAETKIENGLGEPEQWASLLPPELFRQLRDRVDLDFAFTNKTTFAADETVRLDLYIKNVSALLVKVFQINTFNYYREHQREVNTDINLDGLVANTEQTHAYADPPLRRMARRFEFPELNRPGVYVIDFIGSGKSSRALIRKGRLRPLVTTGPAGQRVTVVDDANRLVKDATLWLGGHEYLAGEDGTITVPFSTSPGRRAVVLRRGDFACLDYLEHLGENYELRAGIHVDREALLSQRIAAVLIRPGLYLNGTPVSLTLLEKVRLRLSATDLDGIATSTEIPDFRLFEDRESIHEFRVPARLARLAVTLRAAVKSLSLNKTVDLEASEVFPLNGIARTDKIEDLHLARFGPDYVIELRGRTGEPRSDRPVRVLLKHRDFREAVEVTLKTDAHGRLLLGPLVDIDRVTAVGPEQMSRTWALPLERHTYRQVVHAKAGETLALPYLSHAASPRREEVALFEVRGDHIRADRFDALAIRDGMLELRGLAAGDYDLWLKRSGERIRVRLTDGPVAAGFILGRSRHLQVSPLQPVQVASIAVDAENLTVRLRNPSPFTRVHVFATRYLPAYSAFANLGKVRAAELSGSFPAHAESAYVTGRNIGDEYRYVLDRKQQRKFPGNMLERPQLLLNPWAVRSTETGEQLAGVGEGFRASPKAAPGIAIPKPSSEPGPVDAERGEQWTENLDFLADASAVHVNLVPDRDGIARIPRGALGPHAWIHVVAVDPLHTTSRFLFLPEHPARFLDLRLLTGLDPKGHFTQQKLVSVLPQGQQFVVADVLSSRFAVYDSLAKVFSLYATLSRDPKLAEFAFVVNWPRLKPEEKRAQYSKHACHELNFFLSRKDPEFFREVVKPYLVNKKDKTFLDRWLLGEELSEFVQPWRNGRLNTVERILLAQRVTGEAARTSRHLADLLRLQPPNLDRQLLLFETAVRGGVLDTEDDLGVNRLKEAAPKSRLEDRPDEAKDEKKEPQTLTQPPAPSAPGPARGGTAGMPVSPNASEVLGQQMERQRQREGRSAGKDLRKSAEEKESHSEPEADFFGRTALRDQLRQLYRRLDPTQEWVENNYYHLPIHQQTADLVTVNPFWLDYARYDGKGPFLSRHLAEASRNFTEMLFVLSVLDLPFTSGKHAVAFDGNRMTLTPAGPAVVYHEEVRPAGPPAGRVPVLVTQNFYRPHDRFREEDGERLDKFITGEFLTHTVYGCQVVVTNPTSSRQRLSVLVQIPVGAVPVGNGQYTRTVLLDLEPYRTQTVDYLFYFPRSGRFVHFPVHVAKNEVAAAAAPPVVFEVVEKPTRLDTESWEFVSQNGTAEEVLAFLNRENVHALDLEKIAFRMRDRAFFESVIQLLQGRHAYHPTLWSYGLYHNAVPVIREYLLHADALVAECGGPLVSPLLTIDPVARHQYEHREYHPLVNARTHALGRRRQIVNPRIHEQYHHFLKQLSYRQQLNSDDLLAVTYYLLLQDRIEEALATFARVHAEQVMTRIQYDYCAAYLDLYSDAPSRAREIAARYADHPVDRWRIAFRAVLNQLDEIEGKGTRSSGADDRGQRLVQLAATEPAFEFTVEGDRVNLTWQNLQSVRLNFYLMDVELLFSRDPFAREIGGQFAMIRPNASRELTLPAGQNRLTVPLPEELQRRNVLVEVTAAGKKRAVAVYAKAFQVQFLENYGQIHVSDAVTAKGLPKVYVKVYAQLADGQIKFHKDGYTDHRGRFDYVSVSTPQRAPITRFAVLTLSEERGADIRQVQPPLQ